MPERGGWAGGAQHQVELLEGREGLVADDAAHTLCLGVVRIIIASAEDEGAEEDAAFHLGAEAFGATQPVRFIHTLCGTLLRWPKRMPSKRARLLLASAVARM